MKESLTLEMVLAFAVLALGIFAYGESASPAWWWMVLLGGALSPVVFVNGWSARKEKLAGPLTLRGAVFVAAELVLPVVALCAVAVALTIGGDGWHNAAIVLSIALSVAALI